MSEPRKSIYRVSALGISYGSCDGLCRASLTRQKAQLGRLGVSARASACHLTSSYTSFKAQIRAHLLQGFSSPRPAPQTQGVCLPGTCLPQGSVLLSVSSSLWGAMAGLSLHTHQRALCVAGTEHTHISKDK